MIDMYGVVYLRVGFVGCCGLMQVEGKNRKGHVRDQDHGGGKNVRAHKESSDAK